MSFVKGAPFPCRERSWLARNAWAVAECHPCRNEAPVERRQFKPIPNSFEVEKESGPEAVPGETGEGSCGKACWLVVCSREWGPTPRLHSLPPPLPGGRKKG